MSKFQEKNLVQQKIELIINKYKSPLIYENRKIKCEKIIFFLDKFRENEIIKKNRKWLSMNIISVIDIKRLNYIFIYLKQFDKNLEILGNRRGEFILDITEYLLNLNLISDEEIEQFIINIKNNIEKVIKGKFYISLANNKFLSIIANMKLIDENKDNIFILKNNKHVIDSFLVNYPIKILENKFIFDLTLETFNILKIKFLGDIKLNLIYLSELFPDSYINYLSMTLGIGDIFQYKNFKPQSQDFTIKIELNEKDNVIDILIKKLEYICIKLYKYIYSNKFLGSILSLLIFIKDDRIIKKSRRNNSFYNSFEDIYKNGKELLFELLNRLKDDEKLLIQKISLSLKHIINFDSLSNEIWEKEHQYLETHSEKKRNNKNNIKNFLNISKKQKKENKVDEIPLQNKKINLNNTLTDITKFIDNKVNIEKKDTSRSKSIQTNQSQNKYIHLIKKGKKSKSKSKSKNNIKTTKLDSYGFNINSKENKKK